MLKTPFFGSVSLTVSTCNPYSCNDEDDKSRIRKRQKMSYIKVNVAAVGPNHLCKAFAALHTAEFTTGFHHGLNIRACIVDTIYLRNGDVIHHS